MPLNYRMLTIGEAAQRLNKSEAWLRGKIRRGQGPELWRSGGRAIEIREIDLDSWFNQNTEESSVKSAERIVAKVKGLTEQKQEVDLKEFTRIKESLLPHLNKAREALKTLMAFQEEHGPILNQISSLDWMRLYEVAGRDRAEALLNKVDALNKSVSDTARTLSEAIDDITNLKPSISQHGIENLIYEAKACVGAHKMHEEQFRSITNLISLIEEAGDQKLEVKTLKEPLVTGRPSSWNKAIG